MKIAIAAMLLSLSLSVMATEPTPQTIEKEKRTELNEIHTSVLRRFKFQSVPQDEEVFMYYSSSDYIRGDCDDFASAVYFELWKREKNPKVYVYDYSSMSSHREQYRHVIVCADDFCFDNNKERVFPYENFLGRLEKRYELVASGKLNHEKLLAVLVGERAYASREEAIYATAAGED